MELIKRKIDPSRTRCHLMDVAAKLFANNGLDGVSTRDIAKKAKLNISLISYYFGGKERLYKEVMTDFAMRSKEELERQLEGIDFDKMDRETFLERARSILSKMVEMKFNDKDTALLLHRELVSGLPYARKVYEEVFRSIGERLVGIFKVAQDKGILKPDINCYVLFFSMAQAVDGYLVAANANVFMYEKCPALENSREEYIDQIFKIFIRGACCEPK